MEMGTLFWRPCLLRESGVTAVLANISFSCLYKTSQYYNCTACPDLLQGILQSPLYLRMIPVS